ncbi:TPA: protein kinase [Candidatus Woesearchaeota archaeon]|nr:protein kinase [Candidatus Woesearchaeota archaeon]HIH39659.1 protein kinase [Candidatus Woesearchaeota archaeon]
MALATIEERIKEILLRNIDEKGKFIDSSLITDHSIDTAWVELLQTGAGVITEKVDIPPGTQVQENAIVGEKIGSGAIAHQYALYTASNPSAAKELPSVWKQCVPNSTRQHYIGLLKRKDEELMHGLEGESKNKDYVNATIVPAENRIAKELRYTRPTYNYDCLRKITDSPHFEKQAAKFLSNRSMEEAPTSRTEFEMECSLLSRAWHKCIPQLKQGITQTKDGIYYVVGHADAVKLTHLIDPKEEWWRGNPRKDYLPIKVTVAIMHQFYDTIASLQRRGILYQDINPGNIMPGHNGLINLIDFGFAEEILPGKTNLSSLGGDEDYYAPCIVEHLEESGRYSHKAKKGHSIPLDLRTACWSAGILTYLLAADDVPFKGETFSKLANAIMTKRHTHPGSVNPEYNTPFGKKVTAELIDKPLRKNPAERPFASNLENACERLLSEEGNQTSEEILQEFMAPLTKIREGSYIKPEVKVSEAPRYVRRTKGSSRVDLAAK